MNIPKGQLVRLRMNCTTESNYRQQAVFIWECFIDKGYEKSFVQQKIKEVRNIERQNFLNKAKEEPNYSEIPLILNYNTQLKNLETIIRKQWKILTAD